MEALFMYKASNNNCHDVSFTVITDILELMRAIASVVKR